MVPQPNQQVRYVMIPDECDSLYEAHDGQIAVCLYRQDYPGDARDNPNVKAWKLWFSDGTTFRAYEREIFQLEEES